MLGRRGSLVFIHILDSALLLPHLPNPGVCRRSPPKRAVVERAGLAAVALDARVWHRPLRRAEQSAGGVGVVAAGSAATGAAAFCDDAEALPCGCWPDWYCCCAGASPTTRTPTLRLSPSAFHRLFSLDRSWLERSTGCPDDDVSAPRPSHFATLSEVARFVEFMPPFE